jgi:Domain of unknown function (DUF1707)/Domain of unknown function (DUF4190)
MSFEPSTPGLRASDADREAVVERLHRAATEGRLDADELEERIGAAYAAKLCTDLDGLVADVTPPEGRPVPVRPAFVARRTQMNGLAVASLVTSLLWMGWIGSVLGIIFGHAALRQIRRSSGREHGRAFAYAGLAIGYVAVLIAAVAFLSQGAWS